MKWNKYLKGSIVLLLSVGLLGMKSNLFSSKDDQSTGMIHLSSENKERQNPFLKIEEGNYLFETKPLDRLGRATEGHIILNQKDLSKKEREPKINFNPAGWKNYQVKIDQTDGSYDKYWVFNRGHLIGYQFSKMNEEPTNLVIQTSWSNKGSYHGMDQMNQNSILFYEMGLRRWLENNETWYLDYTVTAEYENEEMIPRKIKLKYHGLNQYNQAILIVLGSTKEQIGDNQTEVVIDNDDPNIKIDYKNVKIY